jgi:hypothetical protein
MDSFWTASANLPFLIALGLFFGLSLLQGISFLMGLSLDQSVDHWVDAPDADIDVDMDLDIDGVDSAASSSSLVWGALDWLNAGRIPLLFLVLLFLGSFGLAGYLLQLLVLKSFGFLGGSWLMVLLALPVAIPVSRYTSIFLGKILPKDETSAVSRDSFLGKSAVIVLGVARPGSPAQAKLKDDFGQTHYIMVEPDSDERDFSAGDTVVVVRFARKGSSFFATLDPFNTPTADSITQTTSSSDF